MKKDLGKEGKQFEEWIMGQVSKYIAFKIYGVEGNQKDKRGQILKELSTCWLMFPDQRHAC